MAAEPATPSAPAGPAPAPDSAGRRCPVHAGLLGLIVLAAAVLRLAGLSAVPPGLNQDEAANAWNAWCLLKTGRDQYEVPWPVFYSRALGENRSVLYFYATLPFQAVGGLNALTTRLPAAVGGVLTVLLLYWLGARLFDRTTGLLAAALLTLSPWHIQLSRLGLEAALAPLLTCLGLAALLWARFPLSDRPARPAPARALLAGLVAGGVCYGYAAVRLVLPLLLLAGVALTARRWWHLARTRRGAAALAALLLGGAATFGPLAYQHLVHPEGIARRAGYVLLWEPGDSPGARIGKVAARYLAHFGPDFLFVTGEHQELYSAHGYGTLHWYALPLLLAGLAAVAARAGQSAAARLLLAWLVLYPLGDCFYRHALYTAPDGTQRMSLYLLRSAPGLPGLTLLAAAGAAAAHGWLRRRRPRAAGPAAAVYALAALVAAAGFVRYYFADHPRRPAVYHAFHADLMEACAWLRPRVDSADAVFITASQMNVPYIVTLVGVQLEPEAWFRAERDVRTFEGWEWEHHFRVGKFHFVHDRTSYAALDTLLRNGRPDRVIFIMRPGETALERPAHTIRGPDGTVQLEIHDVRL